MDYVPHTDREKREMLKEIGVDSAGALFNTVPEELQRLPLPIEKDVPRVVAEQELFAHLKELSNKNCNLEEYASFLGAGAYDHFCPSIVDHLSSRGEFLTAYTPYQAEASQGTLQAIYEFQTLVAELTAMDVANASLYDGASALAEAALLAIKHTEKKKVVVSSAVHPEYRQVLDTYLKPLGGDVIEVATPDGVTDPKNVRAAIDTDTAAVVAQNPNFFGCLEEMDALSDAAHEKGALLVSCVNPVSLGIIRPPGEYDADVAVGDAQPLGNYISYGGPHVGFFAVKSGLMRKVPGRIAGLTNDAKGLRGFVLTLQAREQHIRRQRAASNICTNQNLLALRTCIYLSALGRDGLRELAEINMQKSHYAFDSICALDGFEPLFGRDTPFFNEFAIRLPKGVESTVSSILFRNGIIGGLPLGSFYRELEGSMLFCVTEKNTRADIDKLVKTLAELPGRIKA